MFKATRLGVLVDIVNPITTRLYAKDNIIYSLDKSIDMCGVAGKRQT